MGLDRPNHDLDSDAQETKGVEERSGLFASAASGGLGRIGSDFAATIMVCCGLGWFADYHWGSQPWGLIGMTFVGAIVAFVNIVRVLGGYDADRLGWRKSDEGQKGKNGGN